MCALELTHGAILSLSYHHVATLATLPTIPPALSPLPAPQLFKDATLFFSRGSPNIAAVIPAMDLIDNTLTRNARNEDLDIAVRTAIGIAKKTLNRYYKLSDLSSTYRIALGEYSYLSFGTVEFLKASLICVSQSCTPATS